MSGRGGLPGAKQAQIEAEHTALLQRQGGLATTGRKPFVQVPRVPCDTFTEAWSSAESLGVTCAVLCKSASLCVQRHSHSIPCAALYSVSQPQQPEQVLSCVELCQPSFTI